MVLFLAKHEQDVVINTFLLTDHLNKKSEIEKAIISFCINIRKCQADIQFLCSIGTFFMRIGHFFLAFGACLQQVAGLLPICYKHFCHRMQARFPFVRGISGLLRPLQAAKFLLVEV